MQLSLPSPISTFNFEGRKIFLKHDEQIHPYFSGNKFRKLYFLYKAPSDKFHTLISYGGIQSNAMLSLSALCQMKKWHFIYYVKSIPKQLDTGNFTQALKLGMQVKELGYEGYREGVENLHLQFDDGVCVVAQGGAETTASEGIKVLADEIIALEKKFTVVTPSGTGTTAFYLAKHLQESDCNVVTSPCVGDEKYLQEQMQALGSLPSNLKIINSEKKYHFAKPYKVFYELHQKLLSQGKEFDMIYGVKMFQALKENLKSIEGDILYVHSGGLLGNQSMLKRYEHKKMIEI